MAREEIAVCDICRKAGAEPWVLSPAGGTPLEVDVCEEHGMLLNELYEKGRLPKGKRGPYERFQKRAVKETPPPAKTSARKPSSRAKA